MCIAGIICWRGGRGNGCIGKGAGARKGLYGWCWCWGRGIGYIISGASRLGSGRQPNGNGQKSAGAGRGGPRAKRCSGLIGG